MIDLTKEGDKFKIELSNGHAAALEKIKKDYGIKDEKEALGFMLAVLDQAEGKKIEVNGTTYLPSEKIKASSEAGNNGQQPEG